jgi:two-component system NarL family response regulator
MKILLVDDHELYVDGLRHLLEAHGMQVVGVAHDGLEALHKARTLRPDLILMDIAMPRCNGLQATRLILAEWPEIKIIMLTISEDDDNLFEAIKSGACGYLLKEVSRDQFFALLAGLKQGQAPFSPGLAARILHEFKQLASVPPQTADPTALASLTPRQIEILTLVAHGLSYKQIAAQLNLAESTVKNHMHAVMANLHLQNRAQVMTFATHSGLAGKTVERPAPKRAPPEKY